MTEEMRSAGDMEESRSYENNSDGTNIKDSPILLRKNRRSRDIDRKRDLGYAILQMVGKLIPSFVFRIKAVYILWLPRERWVPPRDRSWLRWATIEDADQITKLVHRTVNVQSRLNWGGRGVIREIDGQIVGCLWITRESPTYDDWLQVQLSKSDGWIFDVFVSPDYRGEGIAKQMGDFARAEMAGQGVRRVAAMTNVLNLAAFRSSDKSKYKVSRIWYVRFLGWTLVRFSNRWRFGWWRRSHPLQVPLSMLTDLGST